MAQKSNGCVLLSKAKVMKSEAQLSNGSVLIAEQSQGEAAPCTARAQHRFEPLSKGKAERCEARGGEVRHRIAKASRDAERQGDGLATLSKDRQRQSIGMSRGAEAESSKTRHSCGRASRDVASPWHSWEKQRYAKQSKGIAWIDWSGSGEAWQREVSKQRQRRRQK